MRITPKQFALSLYESVEGKSAGEVKAVIKKFVEILAEKNQIALADKIINEFSKIWQVEHGQIEAEITSANELSRETVKLLKAYIAKLSGAREIKVDEKVDRNILGGVVIKYGDKVLDGSLKNSLAELKDKLIK
jgi:F-type H+-transporting ATPase subunit delta